MNLLDYIDGQRRGPQANRLEREALVDPFLAEALEGYEAVGGDAAASLERLHRRVERRSTRLWRWTVRTLAACGAAAAVFVATGVIFRVQDPVGPVPILPYLAENTRPVVPITGDTLSFARLAPTPKEDPFRRYLDENLFPVYNARGERIAGRVILEFRVDRRGRPAGIRLRRSLSPEADRQARHLLENGPAWPDARGRVQVEIEFP